MTYYPPTPIISQAHQMFRVSQSHNDTLKALIAFYQDEQYWVRRTRMGMRTDESERTHIDESFTATLMDTTPDIPMPTNELPRPPTSLSLQHHDLLDGDASATPMMLDSEPGVNPARMVDGPSHAHRPSRTRIDLDDLLLQPRHGGAPRRRASSSPSELKSRILETFSDLLDARMESCQRMSRMIEMRECRLF